MAKKIHQECCLSEIAYPHAGPNKGPVFKSPHSWTPTAPAIGEILVSTINKFTIDFINEWNGINRPYPIGFRRWGTRRMSEGKEKFGWELSIIKFLP